MVLVEPEQVRGMSSALFGHRYRLELLAALVSAGDEGVCMTVLADQTGVATSVFYPPLRMLADLGMVRRVGPSGPDRRVFYVTTDHAAWTGLRNLMQDLDVVISRRGRAGEVTE
jgi:DNA-binding IclR family transcriptional regulator